MGVHQAWYQDVVREEDLREERDIGGRGRERAHAAQLASGLVGASWEGGTTEVRGRRCGLGQMCVCVGGGGKRTQRA